MVLKKMQKNVNKEYLFSKEFILKFKNVLKDIYGYEEYMDFLIVPSIFGGKTLSYIPLLSYSDKDSNSTEELKELAKDNEYQIRVLNFEHTDFKDGDPVTMRMCFNDCSSEEILANMKSKYRKIIKNSIRKNNFLFKIGNSEKLIEDFYKIFTNIMHKHGTPPLDKKLFYTLKDIYNDDVVFYNVYDQDRIIAGYCVLMDKDISYGSWGGLDDEYRDRLVGHFAYWNIIKDVCDNRNKKIFDFGRSPYGSGGYIFKHRFGAKPTKIDILTSQKTDIYSKYSLASSIWKKLPKSFVDTIGPKLCKYLVDL